MPLFTYQAKTQEGKIIQETVQASSREDAASQLKADNLQVLTIKPVETGIYSSIFAGKISVSEKAALCRFLAIMLRTGLSLPEAVDIIGQESTNKRLKKILSDVSFQTRRGVSLSSVLSQYSQDFDPVFLTLVKAGENSGTLEQTFNYLAQQLATSHELTQKIKGSLMYPAVIIIAMVAVGTLMLTFVLPQISTIFLKMNVPLPATTRLILNVGQFVGSHIPLTFAIIGGHIFCAVGSFLLSPTRRLLITALSKFPAVKKLLNQIDVARFSRTLSTLLKSGVPIIDALNVSADSLTQPHLKEQAKDLGTNVAKGQALSTILSQNHNDFPSILVQTVRAGEKTGTLEEVLQQMASFYETEIEFTLKRLTALLEPVLMLLVGVAVGVMVILIISPIYSIIGGLQQTMQR